jgi:division protein CdvB (Snf7/Vps24/ESCRT-III family)
LIGTCQLSIDDVECDVNEQFNNIFTQYTIDTIFSSYAAAQNRVHQQSAVLHMLQREADEWAQKVQKAIEVLPEYQPIGWLSGVWPLPGQTNS